MHTEDRNYRKLHRVGALLVHGVNGNLGNMHELTRVLTSYNIVTLNVLFPGHGNHMRNMQSINWSEWSNAVHEELRKLRQWCKYVFLIGHSLGGALCLHIAASESVTGIVTMCEPVSMYPGMFPPVRMTKYATVVPPKLREDLRSYEARRRYKSDAFSKSSMTPVESMLHYLPSLRAELPSVTAPTLIMTAVHDQVILTNDGQTIYRLIGSREKYLVKIHQSHHLLMKAYDEEEIFARVFDFIQSHARGI